MSLDPEDFKPKPERCSACGRLSVEPRLYAWQTRLCDRCQDERDIAAEREAGRREHICDCCGGHPWSAFDPDECPICLGAGRFPDQMPVADALADAETLRGWLFSEHLDSLASDLLAEAGSAVEWSASDWFVASDIRRKARAAFRAVPALRGDQ